MEFVTPRSSQWPCHLQIVTDIMHETFPICQQYEKKFTHGPVITALVRESVGRCRTAGTAVAKTRVDARLGLRQEYRIFYQIIERAGSGSNAFDSCMGGVRFESWLWQQLQSLKCLLVLLILSTHGRFLPHNFAFIIIYLSSISRN
jgi:hypothetical protein